MGFCDSPNLFQENTPKIFEGFDVVRAYVDDVILITKNEFLDQLKAPKKVLQKLTKSGLKVNSEK